MWKSYGTRLLSQTPSVCLYYDSTQNGSTQEYHILQNDSVLRTISLSLHDEYRNIIVCANLSEVSPFANGILKNRTSFLRRYLQLSSLSGAPQRSCEGDANYAYPHILHTDYSKAKALHFGFTIIGIRHDRRHRHIDLGLVDIETSLSGS